MNKENKRNKRFEINIWTRYFILVLITIILGFLINLFLFAPIKTLADENAWLGFYGSIVGAGIAGIITLWGIEYTIKSTFLNVKPTIRPVKTNLFLYDKEGTGIFVTNKSMSALMKEYAESRKVYFSEIDKLDYMGVIAKIVDEYKGTKWESVFAEIDVEELTKEIKNICALKTYNDAMDNLWVELPEKYKDGVGTKLAESINEYYRRKIARESMSEAQDLWGLYYWVYNVGAGNALDIRISWDFSKNHHKILCDNLGFNDDDYSEMNNRFLLDKIEVAEADVMLNSNEENKVKAEIPYAVILFIKNLYVKSLKNTKENKHMNNNALVGEHQIAELNISYIDIHGKEHVDYYDVMFRTQSAIQEKYGYKEEYFYFKFCKK